MSQTEIFRPSNGDLQVRSYLAPDYPAPTDTFRKSRPTTPNSSGGRFGNLSQNSFFTRHNPHPARVRHMKGLLDIPICSVNDTGYMANPRFSLQFPPNNYNEDKLNSRQPRIPVNALNVNSQLHPINTITGIQNFTGLQSFPFREKAVPKVGLVPVEEAWRDELKKLTDSVEPKEMKSKEPPKSPGRPRTQYSADTGRLIPPPSRAMSRQSRSRGQSRGFSRQGGVGYGPFQHIMAEPDIESMVLTMLAQILQTDDINAVKAWIVSAPENDKKMALDLIRAAMAGRDEYSNMQPYTMEQESDFKLPPINGNQGNSDPSVPTRTDRLVIEETKNPQDDMRFTRAVTPTHAVPAQSEHTHNTEKPMVVDNGDYMSAPISEVFKQKSIADANAKLQMSEQFRPLSTLAAQKPIQPVSQESSMGSSQQYPIENNAVLRFTKSPKESENSLKEWRPAAVMSPNTF